METALLEILDGVFTAADDKLVTVLIRFDLSVAFETVEYQLLDCVQLKFRVMEVPLNGLQFCFEGLTHFIKMGQHESHATEVDVGICAWTSVVHNLLQLDRRRHHSPIC